MNDRVFTIAFGASLAVHLLLIIGQLLSWGWFTTHPHPPIEVVYDQEAVRQEVQQLQDELRRAKSESAIPGGSVPTLNATLSARPQIRIPDRPALSPERTERLSDRPSIVDLTNLVDAARGDPVLLSYFSAIREQIQRMANGRAWLTGQPIEGLVYVSFVLSAGGEIRGITIVSDRSSNSPPLQDIALRIVKSAAPFPPFPPSVGDSSKTIVVPLEFLLGG